MTHSNDSIPPSSGLGQPSLENLDARMVRMERRFDSLVGVPPDALTGQGGSGLVKAMLDVRKDFEALGDRVDALTKAIEADASARKAEAEAKAKGREPVSKVAWFAIGTLTSASVLELFRWLTTLHH